jgi:hypothetical protein
MDWNSFWIFLPVILIWAWHSYRIDALRDRLTMLEVKLQEEKNAAFNENLTRALQQVLADDDQARALHGLPPHNPRDD